MFATRVRANFLDSAGPQEPLQLADVRELAPAGQLAGRVDRERAVGGPPAAHGVEVLQGEAHRVHLLVARGALGVGPMGLHPLPQRGVLGGLRALVQLGDVGRGRRGRRPEDLLQDPLARA